MDVKTEKTDAKVKRESNQLDREERDSIIISIVGVKEIRFTVKNQKSLSLPMRWYSRRMGQPMAAFKFVYDGVRVTERDTPASLEMVDGDVIEAYETQLGG